jgi:6-pyruvoyltetrahydropterin/6-carboxytetrahydropterin synthase
MTVTRVYRFSASHRLHSGALSDKENRDVYGRCNNPFGHGHNYRLEVSVKGKIDKSTGRVVDPALLDEAVTELVLNAFEHRNMNREIPDLGGKVPTTEVVAEVIERRLLEGWPEFFPGDEPVLARVRIYETRNNVFEVAFHATKHHEAQQG